MMKTVRWILLIVAVAAVAAVVVWWNTSPKADKVTMQDAHIRDIREMVQLCSVDFYEEIPVKATIGRRHIFAKETFTGSVSFDLERLRTAVSGDTLFVELPPEKIEIYESTSADAYQVIDVWNDTFLGDTNITTAEENKIKSKAAENMKRRLYAKGTVREARREAVTNLRSLLGSLTERTVVVSDPAPAGTYH